MPEGELGVVALGRPVGEVASPLDGDAPTAETECLVRGMVLLEYVSTAPPGSSLT